MDFRIFCTVSVLIVASVTFCAGQDLLSSDSNLNVTFDPDENDLQFIVFADENETVMATVSGIIGNVSVIDIVANPTGFFTIVSTNYETQVENETATFPINVRGLFIGVSYVVIRLEHVYTEITVDGKEVERSDLIEIRYRLRCGIRPTILNTLFTYTLTVWLVISYVTMGAKIDVDVVWSKIRRPFGLIIGIVCQFGIMPITAFVLANIFPISNESAIGLLIEGSCPGGWISNVFALMMDVDFILSITMTFCSSFVALVMMPFNLFLYARPFIGNSGTLKTPYKDICIQLSLMMVPVAIGMFILRKYPRVAEKMTKGLKPISMGLIVISLALGIPAMWYVFITSVENYIVAGMLPFIGGIFGFTISKICRRNTKEAFTIALETGIQNSLLALVVAKLSYPFPENYLIARLPLLTAMLTIIQGTILIVAYVIYSFILAKKGREALPSDKGYEQCDMEEGDKENGVGGLAVKGAGELETENNNKTGANYTALKDD